VGGKGSPWDRLSQRDSGALDPAPLPVEDLPLPTNREQQQGEHGRESQSSAGTEIRLRSQAARGEEKQNRKKREDVPGVGAEQQVLRDDQAHKQEAQSLGDLSKRPGRNEQDGDRGEDHERGGEARRGR